MERKWAEGCQSMKHEAEHDVEKSEAPSGSTCLIFEVCVAINSPLFSLQVLQVVFSLVNRSQGSWVARKHHTGLWLNIR